MASRNVLHHLALVVLIATLSLATNFLPGAAAASVPTGFVPGATTVSAPTDFSCTSVTQIPQAECQALVALYNSTNGAAWINKSGWLTWNTPCNWFGVTCIGDHVSKLSLAGNHLRGSIPPELGNLANVQELWLNRNELSGSMPPQLGNLFNLYVLLLNNNQLTGSIPPELGNLTNLWNLNLSANQLSGSIPSQLGNLVNLFDLDLGGNQLTGSIPPQLGNLVNLFGLYLYRNQLTGSIPAQLSNLTNLVSLHLYSNQLTGSIPAELGNLANLQQMELEDNQLTGGLPPQLSNLTSLTSLNLARNQLTGSIPPQLGTMANLVDLRLYQNQIAGSIPPQLGDLPNLFVLSLDENQLTGSLPAELGDLSNLSYLSLQANQLTGGIPSQLGNLTNLYQLNLNSNQLTGAIPVEFGNLVNLRFLYVNSNQLTGSIPLQLGSLTNLYELDLHSNQLNGDIPGELCSLADLWYLPLEYNALVNGPACIALKDPDWAQTQTVAPTGMSAAVASPTSVQLQWTPILYTGDGGYYQVSYATTAGGPYTVHGVTADKTATGYLADNLLPGTTYYFVVRTFTPAHGDQQSALWSTYSTEATATLPLVRAIRVANIRDEAFSVSWVSEPPLTGRVRYGTDPAHLTLLAEDDRGAGTVDDTHHVTVSGLNPGTTYYFDVIAGAAIDDNGGAHYPVTTGAALSVPGIDTVYGQVVKPDGATYATGAMVYVTVSDADGQGAPGRSAPLSTLVTPNLGYWFLNLAEARTPDNAAYFAYSPAGDRTEIWVEGAADCQGRITVDTTNDSPVATITLSCLQQAALLLTPGWNLLSLPLDPLAPYQAQSLLDAVNGQGGNCGEIDRWLNGGWDAHLNGLPFNDFAVDLAKGYFLRCAAVSQWTLDGYALRSGVPISLQPGWNLAGVPYPSSGYTAQSLLDDIASQGGACGEIDRWFNGGWSAHINGLPFNDFAVAPDKAYFLRCSQPSTFTPGVEPQNRARVAWPDPAAPIALAPVDEPDIGDVLLTNRRDVALTVTWRTDQPSDGWVEYGTTPQLDQVAYDDRGEKVVSAVHHVTVTGLRPETTLYYRIHSGGTILDQEGKPFEVTTLATAAPGEPVTVYGQAMFEDGAPAAGAVLYAWPRGATDARLEPLSATVDGWGYWVLSFSEKICIAGWQIEIVSPTGTRSEFSLPDCQSGAVFHLPQS